MILQLILVISTKYRTVSCAHDAQFPRAISKNVPWYGVFVVIFSRTILIRFGFCEIRYNQGLGKCYKPLALVDKTYLDLDYSETKKTHPIIGNYAQVIIVHDGPNIFLRI